MTTYYIDNSSSAASNGNAGTSMDAPLQSLSALQKISLQPGDVVAIRAGTVYNEAVSGDGALTLTASGTAGNPITITSYGDGTKPVINNTSTAMYSDGILLEDAHYVTIDGIAFHNATLSAVDVDANSSHITVENSEITNVGEGVLLKGTDSLVTANYIHDLHMVKNTPATLANPISNDDDYGAEGVTIAGSRNEVSFNKIVDAKAASYDYGTDGGGFSLFGDMTDVSIHDNYVENSDGFLEAGGISATLRNLNISNNVSFDNGSFIDMHNGGGLFASAFWNVQVSDNTVVDQTNGSTDAATVFFDAPATAAQIHVYENIFQLNAGDSVYKQQGSYHADNLIDLQAETTHLYNDWGMTLGRGEQYGDPGLPDAAGGDFTPAASGLAQDAGATIGAKLQAVISGADITSGTAVSDTSLSVASPPAPAGGTASTSGAGSGTSTPVSPPAAAGAAGGTAANGGSPTASGPPPGTSKTSGTGSGNTTAPGPAAANGGSSTPPGSGASSGSLSSGASTPAGPATTGGASSGPSSSGGQPSGTSSTSGTGSGGTATPGPAAATGGSSTTRSSGASSGSSSSGASTSAGTANPSGSGTASTGPVATTGGSNAAMPTASAGAASNDAGTGSAPVPTLTGDKGDDTFRIDGSQGLQTIDGGGGTNFIDTRGAAGQGLVLIDLGRGSVSKGGTLDARFSNIQGMQLGADVSVVTGLGSGTDLVYGGTGANRVIGNGATDYIRGGSGDNVVIGGSGNEIFYGSGGADTMLGGTALNFMQAGQTAGSTDTFSGRGGTDFVYGGAGKTILFGGSGTEKLTGGSGYNELIGSNQSPGLDIFDGGSGTDVFYAGIGINILHEATGTDVFAGNGGTDYVFGGSGRSFVYGGSGTLVVTTGLGNQYVQSGTGRTFFNDTQAGITAGRFDRIDKFAGGQGTDLYLPQTLENATRFVQQAGGAGVLTAVGGGTAVIFVSDTDVATVQAHTHFTL